MFSACAIASAFSKAVGDGLECIGAGFFVHVLGDEVGGNKCNFATRVVCKRDGGTLESFMKFYPITSKKILVGILFFAGIPKTGQYMPM